MDDTLFNQRADAFLNHLFDTLDAAIGDQADVDFDDGVLNVALDDGGTFVINKHAPNRQIWLSSPVSGAGHYDLDVDSGQWLNSRDGSSLAVRLVADLEKAVGVSVTI